MRDSPEEIQWTSKERVGEIKNKSDEIKGCNVRDETRTCLELAPM